MKVKTSVDILQELIRIDTQNPPGQEKFITDYIRTFCEQYAIDHTVYTYEEQRSNIVMRIGPSGADDLIILGHMDVVVAKEEDWSCDPFSAEITDGFIYGRGALDMKYFIASALVTIRGLKAIEEQLDRGLICIFTADEEQGSTHGMQRLLLEEGIPEMLRGKTVLNEGGGFALPLGEACPYLFETGQKSVARLTISIPEETHTDPYFPTLTHEKTLVEVIRRMEGIDIDEHIPKTSQQLLERFPKDLSSEDPLLERLLKTMSSSILSPTIIHGGSRNTNTERHIRSSVSFDCRLLPGISKGQFFEKVTEAMEGLQVTIDLGHFTEGYEADVEKRIITLMKETLQQQDPSISDLIPFITPGSNDGKFLKPLGCDVLGFAPLHRDQTFTKIMPLIHGIDERISLKSVAFCTDVLQRVCELYLIGDTYIG